MFCGGSTVWGFRLCTDFTRAYHDADPWSIHVLSSSTSALCEADAVVSRIGIGSYMLV